MFEKLSNILMWPAYKLDDRGHPIAAELYAMNFINVPLVIILTIVFFLTG